MTTPTEKILFALTEHGCDHSQNENGWSARCPAHGDKRPSLSVSEGSDGRALVKCHAGCTVDEICDALGIRVSDLMTDRPPTASSSTQSRKASNKPQYRRPYTTYDTANAAIAALEHQLGKRSDLWAYTDANGDPVGVIVRWDKAGGKEIRPVARLEDRWTIGGIPEPRPLYCLPKLANASRVFITEGEKAADAAQVIGLTATTSAHGSQSSDKTDWSPLAGKECVILPDHDEPGAKYAQTVAAILAKLTPTPVVKVVELPDLPKRGDIADWLDQRDAYDPDELRITIEKLADEAGPMQPDRPTPRIEQFQPFPTGELPEPMVGFVDACSKAIGCDPSYVVLPLLAALAAAIGNSRVLQIKRGWTAPAILWTMCIGESGSQKTPPFRIVVHPLRSLQQHALQKHASVLERFEIEKLEYESALTKWKRKPTGNPPEKPTPPPTPRIVVSDTTIEALAAVLQDNPRGVLLARDELSGWIGSFDKYAKGSGSCDVSHWLSMYNGETMTVDRKTGHRLISVPNASVSITGGIQPTILARAIAGELRENGLAARLLMTFPPQQTKRWVDNDIPPEQLAAVESIVDKLRELEASADGDGSPEPAVIQMSLAARAKFIEYFNEHAKEQADLSGDLAAIWSKLEETAARLALVHHLTRWSGGDELDPRTLDVESMGAGIAMARWFARESKRIYSILDESDSKRNQRRLFEWIERKGGSVTAREVQQGHRQYQTAQEAEMALEELRKAGHGKWEPTPPGRRGQPTRRFVLSTVYGNTLKPTENRKSVDANRVSVSLAKPDDDWGEL